MVSMILIDVDERRVIVGGDISPKELGEVMRSAWKYFKITSLDDITDELLEKAKGKSFGWDPFKDGNEDTCSDITFDRN